ncbi:crosslink repair DNA glycosylase YcaQ family protein [Rhodococcus sp. X156]|uniref:winged helix-turn-helix domain-containing protein n=1 Tax=Rhodococcus sp. X156 TaxID=2499145 RepID=UPI0019CF511C|nr:crosslink repair DNA glycosylase YcaQ family protein [Rhodococcus sp. X156]
MTASAARRTALAAQGFTDPLPTGAPTRRHLTRVVDRVQLLQLDSVSVAVRAHYMPMFSRLGAYDRGLLDTAAWSDTRRKPRLLTEYWAHEAALLSVQDWPLLRWRMREREKAGSPRVDRVLQRSPALPDRVLAAVAELGGATAGQVEAHLDVAVAGGRGPWWDRTDTKIICEWLFAIGELSTTTRVGFQRHYALTRDVLPPELLATEIGEPDAVRALVERSARALGVATEPDLRDYFRLSPRQSSTAVAELVADGVLEPVAVQGWTAPAYRHREARTPRAVQRATLLSPFDSLVFHRPRTERLFDFRYRLEIYTPAAKRVHGYYVYPFLLGEHLVARVDLKAERDAGTLRVLGAFAEPGHHTGEVAAALAEALAEMADWLGLQRVAVEPRGDLSAALGASASTTKRAPRRL